MPSTPTSVTFSKSSPLATIWVPTIMSYSCRANFASSFFMGILGGGGILIHPQDAGLRKELFASSSSAFWVPKPPVLQPQAGSNT